MKRFNVIIFFVLCAVVETMAQGNSEHSRLFHTKDLAGTKWEKVVDYENSRISLMEFTNTEIKYTTIYEGINKTVSYSKPYYLSSTVPTIFEKQNVGRNTSGIYLVHFTEKRNFMDYQTIIKLTDDTLVVFHRKIKDSIGGADVTLTYKRIR